ncbi:UNVERIFIED_CONTAM: hypothetical protein FKN15_034896 [Acipenser sinensis]
MKKRKLIFKEGPQRGASKLTPQWRGAQPAQGHAEQSSQPEAVSSKYTDMGAAGLAGESLQNTPEFSCMDSSSDECKQNQARFH